MKTGKGRLIYAVSEKSSDLFYAGGFLAPDPFIWFQCGEDQGIVLSALEYDRGTKEAKAGVGVYRESDFTVARGEAINIINGIAEKYNIRDFEVPSSFPVGLADRMRSAGLAVFAVDGCFFPEREFKTAEDVAGIEQAMRVTEASMERAIEVLREAAPGQGKELFWNGRRLTSEILRFEIEMTMMRHGGFSDATIVACGRQGAQPHNRGAGALRADEPVIIDIFPRMSTTGWWGDLTRTLVKGKAPALVRKAFDAVQEARDKSKNLIKAGAIPAEIHAFAQKILASRGFVTGKKNGCDIGFFHGLGHGVGLDIHEAPRLAPGNRKPFKGGEIVTVEPGVYYPEWGGMRLEDVVLVGSNGCRCLTRIDTFLEIE